MVVGSMIVVCPKTLASTRSPSNVDPTFTSASAVSNVALKTGLIVRFNV